MSWNKGDSPYTNTPINNQEGIEFALALRKFKMIDLSDPKAVEDRIDEYFQLCADYNTKPLVSGFCRAIGSSRDEVMSWSKGLSTPLGQKLSPASSEILMKSLEDLQVLWEFSFQNNGYRNPVTGIFIAKNNFGYQDTTQNISVKLDASALISPNAIRDKYRNVIPVDVIDVDEPKALN